MSSIALTPRGHLLFDATNAEPLLPDPVPQARWRAICGDCAGDRVELAGL